MEIDLLRPELAERDRRLEKYENSDSSSSTDSLHNTERASLNAYKNIPVVIQVMDRPLNASVLRAL